MADYTLDINCRGLLTQADGRTPDGRPFYFRGKHGWWSLEVGEKDWPTDLAEWPDDYEQIAEVVAEGTMRTYGWMDDAEIRAILDHYFTKVTDGQV